MGQFDSLLRQLKMKLKRQEESVADSKVQIASLEKIIGAELVAKK